MLKTAIVGCGKIADSHAAALKRIEGCEIVAVCDREELMARQLRERFAVPASFADVSALLRTARPDVVHITTPPQSHFAIAKQAAIVEVAAIGPFAITYVDPADDPSKSASK